MQLRAHLHFLLLAWTSLDTSCRDVPRISQSQTPCVGSLPPASAASGANIAKHVAASGAFAPRPTRDPPHPSDDKSGRSAGAEKAASGAASSAQWTNQATNTLKWVREQALSRNSQGPKGWEAITLEGGSMMVRSPTDWPRVWRNWLADCPWPLQSAAIHRNVEKLSQLPRSDRKWTVGNIIVSGTNQYNLIRRSGDGVKMDEVTHRLSRHPYVKHLDWSNRKLTRTSPEEHENAWNNKIHTVDNVKAVVGLTRKDHGKDNDGRQITHYWIGQFSENLDATERGRLVDLLLNVVGYKSWFCEYGRELKRKDAMNAQSEEPLAASVEKATENDGLPVAPRRLPVAPRPESADSECKSALPLSAVPNPPVSQTPVDCPLDTEVGATVEERVSKFNGIVTAPRNQSGMASYSHRGPYCGGIDYSRGFREAKAAEDMHPAVQINKDVSSALRHPVIEQAPPADVSGEGSTQCRCCPQLLSDTG